MSQVVADYFTPLKAFYAEVGQHMPTPTLIDGAAMPEPYRQLLVNRGDMTPTLERFHHARLHLRILGVSHVAHEYRRQVLLLKPDESPVEFGAIRIYLSTLPPMVQQQILAGHRPLGGVLIEHHVIHASHPHAYFSLMGDMLMNQAFGLQRAPLLYGRCNTLIAENGKPIADVVEILPPANM
jgi:chorismate-pyruvate lyase